MNYQQYGYQPYNRKQSNNRLASDGPQSYYNPSYKDYSTKKYQKRVKSTIDIINQQPKDKEYQKHQAEQDEPDDDFRKEEKKRVAEWQSNFMKQNNLQQEEESFYSGNQYGNFFQKLSRVENRRYKFNSKYEIDQDKLIFILYY